MERFSIPTKLTSRAWKKIMLTTPSDTWKLLQTLLSRIYQFTGYMWKWQRLTLSNEAQLKLEDPDLVAVNLQLLGPCIDELDQKLHTFRKEDFTFSIADFERFIFLLDKVCELMTTLVHQQELEPEYAPEPENTHDDLFGSALTQSPWNEYTPEPQNTHDDPLKNFLETVNSQEPKDGPPFGYKELMLLENTVLHVQQQFKPATINYASSKKDRIIAVFLINLSIITFVLFVTLEDPKTLYGQLFIGSLGFVFYMAALWSLQLVRTKRGAQ
jgi:hypothetical protein